MDRDLYKTVIYSIFFFFIYFLNFKSAFNVDDDHGNDINNDNKMTFIKLVGRRLADTSRTRMSLIASNWDRDCDSDWTGGVQSQRQVCSCSFFANDADDDDIVASHLSWNDHLLNPFRST